MSNSLTPEKQVAVISSLAEGSSIRSIERITGIHRDTIMRLGVKVGARCGEIMDSQMRNLETKVLQFDEIWGFVGKKQKHVKPGDRLDGKGDVWTFVAVDAETRMVPAYLVSSTRRKHDAVQFCEDVAARITQRVQISTDALKSYADAVERGFGADADYGQILKVYGQQDANEARRYSPAKLVSVNRAIVRPA
ncbi:MAG TPA: hypothetical protein VK961_04055 [Chthoniobacter sp.]|nr:hypothetical protein [Chthoniobacter sp.]